MKTLIYVRNCFLIALGLSLVAPALYAVGDNFAVNPQGVGTTSTGSLGGGGVTTTTTVEVIDVTGMVLMLPCATVTVSGNLLNVTHVTDLGNGFSTVNFTSRPQGLTGVDGNGGIYSAGGSFNARAIVPTGQVSVMGLASSFTMIGHGSAPTILGTQITQVTINANGTVTTDFFFMGFICQ
jgi:hypothetical protein